MLTVYNKIFPNEILRLETKAHIVDVIYVSHNL